MSNNKRWGSVVCMFVFLFIPIHIYAQYVPTRPIVRMNLDAFKQALDKIDSKNREAKSYVNAIENARDNAISQHLSHAALNHVWVETEDCLDAINKYVAYGDYSEALPIAKYKAPTIISRINDIVAKDKYTDYYKQNTLIYGLKMGDKYSYVLKVIDFWHGDPSYVTNTSIGVKKISEEGIEWDEGSFKFDENTKSLNEIFLSKDYSKKEFALMGLRNFVEKYGLAKDKIPEDDYYTCDLNGIKTTISVASLGGRYSLFCKMSLN